MWSILWNIEYRRERVRERVHFARLPIAMSKLRYTHVLFARGRNNSRYPLFGTATICIVAIVLSQINFCDIPCCKMCISFLYVYLKCVFISFISFVLDLNFSVSVCCCLFGFNVAFNNFSVISRRCLVASGSSVLTFIVLPHWSIMPQTLDMIPHSVTLSWHWVDQS